MFGYLRAYNLVLLSQMDVFFMEMVAGHGVEVMMEVLGWDGERTSALVQACESELSKRLQRVQALQSLSAQNQSTSQPHTERETRAKRCKTHTH